MTKFFDEFVHVLAMNITPYHANKICVKKNYKFIVETLVERYNCKRREIRNRSCGVFDRRTNFPS